MVLQGADAALQPETLHRLDPEAARQQHRHTHQLPVVDAADHSVSLCSANLVELIQKVLAHLLQIDQVGPVLHPRPDSLQNLATPPAA